MLLPGGTPFPFCDSSGRCKKADHDVDLETCGEKGKVPLQQPRSTGDASKIQGKEQEPGRINSLLSTRGYTCEGREGRRERRGWTDVDSMDASLVEPMHSFTLPAFVLVFPLPFPTTLVFVKLVLLSSSCA